MTFIKEKNGWVVGNTTLPEVEITAKKEQEIQIFDIIPKSPKIIEKITEIAKNKDEKTPEQVFDDIKYVFLSVGIGITALALQNFRVWLNTPAGLGLKILIKSLTGTDIEKLAEIAEKQIQETDKSSPKTKEKADRWKMDNLGNGGENIEWLNNINSIVSGCEDIADRLVIELGEGTEYLQITPKMGFRIGNVNGKTTSWSFHVTAIKNGIIYDALTGNKGMLLNDYKNLFEWKEFLNFEQSKIRTVK